jgi:anti-sigma regulatory factor (Ser/Thr protein kinase)
VTDDGREFNPLERPEPDTTLHVHQREPGGLGIHFVRKLFPSVEYRREHGRNVLILRKCLSEQPRS